MPWFMRAVKHFTFSRSTGMVTRYKNNKELYSQPMPDVPELEPARPRDPTTAAWDKQHNRKPDYWFSMDDDEFEEAINQLRAEQRFMPTLGPEIDLFNGGIKPE
ncbi:MAG: hypothetical protein GYB20_11900 [Oceanospirillales bacterium]|nr:hypothetical protein [Oceanospirillales bacterium]MBR9888378.1 hypothetical protein [Oceanospirillales bacterium]